MATFNASAALPSTVTFDCFTTSKPKLSAISILKVSYKVSPLPSYLRYKSQKRLRIRQTIFTTFASSPNSSGDDSLKERADGLSNDAQGPPLLTILAGFFVLFLVLWVGYSVVMWIIGIIVSLSPFK